MPSVPPELKAAREAFVSGLAGTTPLEVLLVTSLVPLASLALGCARRLAHGRATPDGGSRCSGRGAWASAAALDFAALALPLAAVLLSCVEPAAAAGAAAAAAAALAALAGARGLLGGGAPPARGADGRWSFVSDFRGAAMLLTCAAILGVDFPAFPRRFAKAEAYGTGLMDLGVGAVVMSHTLTWRPPGAQHSAPASRGGRMGRRLRRALTLMALGAARLASTRGVGYQEHAAEYGAHWNFFFTLAALAALDGALPLPRRALLPLGLVVGCAYQALLSAGGLIHWVHAARRGPGLLSLNKEGVASIAGYYSLHCLAAGLGCSLQAWADAAAAQEAEGAGRRALRSISRWAAWRGVVARVAVMDGVLWAGLAVCARGLQPVSRRAVNLTYVLWTLAHCVGMLGCTLCVRLLVGNDAPGLMQALNSAMLSIFLAANLLTGAVNLAMDTLHVRRVGAFALLVAYLAVLCGGAAAAHARGRKSSAHSAAVQRVALVDT